MNERPERLCQLKCRECQEKLNLLNEIFRRITGIPFTNEPCILKLVYDFERSEREEEATRLETKIFLKQVRRLLKGGR